MGESLTLGVKDCYSANLDALAEHQPEVAKSVDSVQTPEGAVLAVGRDGSDTFLLPTSTGRSVWFGSSSMPTVSATEMLGGFTYHGGNVILPGVHTGLEPLILLQKMLSYAALFVVEPDLVQLKLAMHLRDYGPALTAGRLVFVTGSDEEQVAHLRLFFERHPGYEWPVHLLTHPLRLPDETLTLQRRLEKIAEAVVSVQNQAIEPLCQALHLKSRSQLPEVPRVAIVTVDPRPTSLEQTRRLSRAMVELGWPFELCVPDAPDKCHVSARLKAIESLGADLVLSINSPAGPLTSLLPEDIPIASWYGPDAVAPPITDADTNRRPMVAADPTVFHPMDLSLEQQQTAEVAVLMDLPDDRPATCKINLSSHVALWEVLQEMIDRRGAGYHDGMAEEILDAAQRKSGTTLKELEVREGFVSLLRSRIAPAGLPRSAVKALLLKGYRVGLWGHNWPGDGQLSKLRRGAIGVGEELNRVFNAADAVVLPYSSTGAIEMALDALAAGANVLCRCPDYEFDKEHPGLAELKPHLHFYRTSQELLNTLGELRRNKVAAAEASKTARAMILARHSVACRIRQVVEDIRKRREGHQP